MNFSLLTLILHLLSRFWNSIRLIFKFRDAVTNNKPVSSANMNIAVIKFVGMLTVKVRIKAVVQVHSLVILYCPC